MHMLAYATEGLWYGAPISKPYIKPEAMLKSKAKNSICSYNLLFDDSLSCKRVRYVVWLAHEPG